MPARLIDGREHAFLIRESLKHAVANLPELRPPGIAVVQVSDDLASTTYVRGKQKAAEEVGFKSTVDYLHDVTQADLNERIHELANDLTIDGIILQMPMAYGLDADEALGHIPPDKDVDGLHPYNAGRLAQGNPTFIPATPLGVLELLRRENLDPTGQRAVVVGRSRLVGRPLAFLLLQNQATVTIAHSRTPDLSEVTRTADILVAATGARGLITGEHVKPGAIVIDVGISRDPQTGNLTGDVDRKSVASVAGALTPVPGGVGPMTIAMLLVNTYRAYRQHLGQA